MPTNPRLENVKSRSEVKPVEIDRWEGEGGHPRTKRREEPSSTIAGILRRLLIDWHVINSPSNSSGGH